MCGNSGGTLHSMRLKLENLRSQRDEWTCFLCCHVRTGAIFIGFWHLLLHLVALSVIVVVVVHPEMLGGGVGSSKTATGEELTLVMDVQAVNCTEMPCVMAKNPKPIISVSSLLSAHSHRFNQDEVNVALFITLCTFVATLLLVYGAFRGQPSHLMPFFFIQVFDFCISSMTMIGYLTYLPYLRQLIRETPAFPLQLQLLAMNKRCLTFFVMLIFIVTLMGKAYCISIVWRCYKYLLMRAQAGRSVLRLLGSAVGGSSTGGSGSSAGAGLAPVDQESQTLVVGDQSSLGDPQFHKKMPGLYPEPPPSYAAAMAAYYEHEARQPLSEATTALVYPNLEDVAIDNHRVDAMEGRRTTSA